MNAFINFARVVVDLSGNIMYLCIHCVKCYRQSLHTVHIQKNILNFLRSKGYDDALTYEGGSSSS